MSVSTFNTRYRKKNKLLSQQRKKKLISDRRLIEPILKIESMKLARGRGIDETQAHRRPDLGSGRDGEPAFLSATDSRWVSKASCSG